MTGQKYSHQDLLNKLADVAVNVGLNLQPEQQLIITAPLEAIDLVRHITKHAYKAHASVVTVFYRDDEATLARFKYADDKSFDITSEWLSEGIAKAYSEGAARLAITGGNPLLLKGQDPQKISRLERVTSRASRPAMEIITQFATNWNIIACATPAWAKQVFPELPEKEALEKLWNAIFKASRVDTEDPVAEWKKHNENLHKRAALLNDAQYDYLHMKGPGTDIEIGLAEKHFWSGGAEMTQKKFFCNPNIPTEEVFTTPHAQKVNGTISSTKPLYHNGNLIDGIKVTFKDGKIISASAQKGENILKQILDTDPGSRHIGEIALVPHSSPISKSGMLFQNTLFDENAASHIALGQCYTKCLTDTEGKTEDELKERGANYSMIHIDWMVGSADIDVDGIKNGKKVPLMRSGEWV